MSEMEKEKILFDKSPKAEEIINNIKIISLIKKNNKDNSINENKTKIFLGKKRQSFEKENSKKVKQNKLLSIAKPVRYTIKNQIIHNNNQNCIICFEEITFNEKHYLHCGHCFHCDCINRWIDMGNNRCPLCKNNVDCDKIISLEENEINNNNDISSNNDNSQIEQNHNNRTSRRLRDRYIYGLTIVILYYYMIRGIFYYIKKKYIIILCCYLFVRVLLC